MVASQDSAGSDAAVADVAMLLPDLRVLSNAEAVNRFERGGFTYFRQISTVLTTVTLSFAVLLITVLLTVSINQRLGEIAALRALGFSRWRVVADVLCESMLIVGGGGLLSLPIGGLLAVGLDDILKRIPGIPADVHFFVFQPSALRVHLSAARRDRVHCRALSDPDRRRAPDCRDAARRGDRVSTSNGHIVEATHISRVFPMPAGPVTAVADVTLRIAPGDHLAIRGPSGCGKSTLLHILGCVETPTAGTLLFNGNDVTKLSDRQRSLLRLRRIGFVFQRFFLLPMLTAAENVELPQSEADVSEGGTAEADQRAAGLCRPCRPSRSSALGALRRRNAARGDCARARQPARTAPRRRADRRAGSGNRRADCRAPRSRQCRRHGPRDRHPRPGARRALHARADDA